MRITDKRFAALMMLPAAAFLAVFVAWPLVQFVINGFYRYNPTIEAFVELAADLPTVFP